MPRFRSKIWPHYVTADGKYGTVENIAAVEGPGIRAYLGLHEAGGRVGFFRKSASRGPIAPESPR